MTTTAFADRVLIDTSVWIEYFRKKAPFFAQVESLIDEGRVCTLRFIIAELVQGARSDPESTVLESATQIFHLLEEQPDTWLEAGRLSSRLRRAGRSVGLGDCYIATMARQHDVPIWSLDKHFVEISRVAKINFYAPTSPNS